MRSTRRSSSKKDAISIELHAINANIVESIKVQKDLFDFMSTNLNLCMHDSRCATAQHTSLMDDANMCDVKLNTLLRLCGEEIVSCDQKLLRLDAILDTNMNDSLKERPDFELLKSIRKKCINEIQQYVETTEQLRMHLKQLLGAITYFHSH